MIGKIVFISTIILAEMLAFSIQLAYAEGPIVVDGSLSDWIDLGILPLGIDPDDQWAGYADLRKLWAYVGDTDLYLAVQVDWEYPVDSYPVIFSILVTPENSSSWYEVIWYNASYTGLLGHGEDQGKIQNVTSKTGWDGVIEFSVPLSSIDNPRAVTLRVDSYSSDWIYNIDLMPAAWEEPYRIPEFPSSFVLVPLMMATVLAVIIYRKKHTRIQRQQS